MDYTTITNASTFVQVAVGVLLILGALAGLEVTLRGCRFLIDAISASDDDNDDEPDDDHKGDH